MSAGARASSLAIAACLAVGIVLSLTATGVAISGYSTDGPAVSAQYPDQRPKEAVRPETEPAVSALSDLARTRRAALRDPKRAAEVRKSEADTEQRVEAADDAPGPIPTAAGYGAIPLLASGLAVIGLGALLRWRRGAAGI